MRWIKSLGIGFLWLFSISNWVFGQKIVGVVTNPEKKPLEFANVAIYQKDKLLQFTQTDEKGFFLFDELPCDSLLLKISLLDYKSEELQIENPCKKQDTLSIILLEEKSLIEEVIVRGKNDVFIIKDTTEFNVSSFSDGTEKSMEDLLRKLPGIEINEKGKISFNNKPIEKITIDGDDLTGKNYELVSRSMPVKIADKVQVIERFNENKLLKNITQSQGVVLNFQVKKEYKNSVFGKITAGIGNNNRNHSLANLTWLSPKLKMLTKASYNNIGYFNSYIDEMSENQKTNNLFNPAEEFFLLENNLHPIIQHRLQGTTPIASQVSVFNDEKVISAHFASKPSKKTKLQGGVLWSKDKNLMSNLFQTYYYNISEPFNFQATDQMKNVPQLWGAQTKLYADLDEKTNMKVQSDFVLRNTLRYYSSQANTNNFSFDLGSNFQKFENQAIFTRKIDTAQAISVQLSINNRNSEELWNLQTEKPIQTPAEFTTSLPIKQNLQANVLFWQLKSTFYARKNKLSYAVGFSKDNRYSFWNTQISNIIPDSTLTNTNDFQEKYTYAFGNLSFQGKKWRFKQSAEFGFFKNNSITYEKLFFQQKTSINGNIRWGSLESSYQYWYDIPKYLEWANIGVYTDYRFFNLGASSYNPSSTHEWKGSLMLHKPYELPNAIISISYRLRQKGYILSNQANENFVLGKWVANESFNFQQIALNGKFKYFFAPLLVNFYFEPTFTFNTYQTLIENRYLDNTATTKRLKIGSGSGFAGGFNFSSECILAENSVNLLKFYTLQGSLSLQYKFSANFYIRYKNDIWKVWQNNQKNQSFFGNIEVSKSWKKFDIELLCHNLYNAQTYLQQWNSEFFSSTNEVVLLARYVMMKVSFNF